MILGQPFRLLLYLQDGIVISIPLLDHRFVKNTSARVQDGYKVLIDKEFNEIYKVEKL